MEAKVVARRRKWTPEQKAVLLAKVEAEGGRVCLVEVPIGQLNPASAPHFDQDLKGTSECYKQIDRQA